MEPVLFYGVPHGCSFGSIVALEWLGAPYYLCRIDMLSKPADYARMAPLLETPALLLETGEMLTESFAIHHHVAARDLTKKLGFAQGTAEFDQLNSILAYLHTTLHGAFSPAWAAFKLPDGDPLVPALRRMAQQKATKAYAHLETILGNREWLVGEGRTVADAYLVGVARWGEDLGLFELAKEFPRLWSYLQKLEADPAVVFAHAIEDGRPTSTSGRFLGEVTIEALSRRVAA